mgnify:CR=1 FL=1
MTLQDLQERREALLGVGAPLFYNEPVHIVRGEGVDLWDADGKHYIDMYNNVPCVGHCNPHVVEAMHKQASTLNVHSRYLHEGILDYAERLTGLHHDGLTSAVFACSGTEANEVAIHIARAATGGRGIIGTDAAYHGNSAEVIKLTIAGRKNVPEFRTIPFPQKYRPLQEGISGEALTDLYLAELQGAIDAFKQDDVLLAAFLVCPLFANEGLPNIPEGFMPRATELIHNAGGLVISDEVQAGFCRTGKWWGYEVSGFVPDIVSMGKPMGNGLPLSGVVASTEHVNTFRKQMRYFNTFAACPLQAAVGMAVLDVLEGENLRENAASVGQYMRDEIVKLQSNCEPVADVRGEGLFTGLEWVSDLDKKTPDREGAIDVANRMKDKGFLICNAGANGNIIKIRPPLVFQKEHADLFLTAFAETLGELDGSA